MSTVMGSNMTQVLLERRGPLNSTQWEAPGLITQFGGLWNHDLPLDIRNILTCCRAHGDKDGLRATATASFHPHCHKRQLPRMKPRPTLRWYHFWALWHCDASRKSNVCDSILPTNCGVDCRREYHYERRTIWFWTLSGLIRGEFTKRKRALVLSPSATSQTKGLVLLGWNRISLAANARATFLATIFFNFGLGRNYLF